MSSESLSALQLELFAWYLHLRRLDKERFTMEFLGEVHIIVWQFLTAPKHECGLGLDDGDPRIEPLGRSATEAYMSDALWQRLATIGSEQMSDEVKDWMESEGGKTSWWRWGMYVFVLLFLALVAFLVARRLGYL